MRIPVREASGLPVFGPVSDDAEIDAACVLDQLAHQEFGLVAAERRSRGLERSWAGRVIGVSVCVVSLMAAIRPRSLQQRSSVNDGS